MKSARLLNPSGPSWRSWSCWTGTYRGIWLPTVWLCLLGLITLFAGIGTYASWNAGCDGELEGSGRYQKCVGVRPNTVEFKAAISLIVIGGVLILQFVIYSQVWYYRRSLTHGDAQTYARAGDNTELNNLNATNEVDHINYANDVHDASDVNHANPYK